MRLGFVLLLLVFVFPSPGNEGKDQAKPTDANRQGNAQQTAVAPVSPGIDKASAGKTEPTAQKENADPTPKPQPFMSHAEWIMSTLTLCYVALTGVYVWYSRKTLSELQRQIGLIEQQDIATKKQLEISKSAVDIAVKQTEVASDTAMRQLRAYLCISKGRLNFTKEGPLEPQLHIVNGGQTPAYEVRSWIEVAVREHPPFHGTPDLAGFRDELQAVGIIPPNGENIMVSRKVPMAVAEKTFLQTRFQILYVYGEITYKDAFGKDRYTKFRLIFGGPTGCRRKIDKDGEEMGYLSMDSEGNEAS
jgi:hypothetical protein